MDKPFQVLSSTNRVRSFSKLDSAKKYAEELYAKQSLGGAEVVTWNWERSTYLVVEYINESGWHKKGGV